MDEGSGSRKHTEERRLMWQGWAVTSAVLLCLGAMGRTVMVCGEVALSGDGRSYKTKSVTIRK